VWDVRAISEADITTPRGRETLPGHRWGTRRRFSRSTRDRRARANQTITACRWTV